ncbi:MAG: Uma2 family endonuclease [Armatimonadota bacterium]|nr:Uma2 family endonuclease [Armatimonadota bacterium]
MSQQTLLQPRRPLPSGKLSYEQFLEWLDEDTWAEWVDGEIELMSPVSGAHQDTGSFLITILRLYVTHRGIGVIR